MGLLQKVCKCWANSFFFFFYLTPYWPDNPQRRVDRAGLVPMWSHGNKVSTSEGVVRVERANACEELRTVPATTVLSRRRCSSGQFYCFAAGDCVLRAEPPEADDPGFDF